ncbi:hypothetical protein HOY80DRAFT_177210 [Tuber brumale]|nr:hypothetical protein HOY80DRAFT_177210 [Tuber brumale]
MFVYSLRSACLFPHTPPHPVRISLCYPLTITGAICFIAGFLCDERRFPYVPSFLSYTSFSSGFSVFFHGDGGLVWRGDGLGRLCKSSLREEFVLGEWCHAWAIGLEHFGIFFLLYFFSSMILAESTV